MKRVISVFLCAIGFVSFAAGGGTGIANAKGKPAAPASRRVISLDAVWQIAEGKLQRPPLEFKSSVNVPGLVDMAQPAFVAVGTNQSGKHREAFWYRRTFTVNGPIPESARLKIHKAAFGTRVLLNGQSVGEHLPSFTPVEFDVRRFLQESGMPNELVVSVGAHRNVLPKGLPDGSDFEKVRYIPGIYDSVELILSGTPRIANVQTVPDVEDRSVRVVISLQGPAGSGARGAVPCARGSLRQDGRRRRGGGPFRRWRSPFGSPDSHRRVSALVARGPLPIRVGGLDE